MLLPFVGTLPAFGALSERLYIGVPCMLTNRKSTCATHALALEGVCSPGPVAGDASSQAFLGQQQANLAPDKVSAPPTQLHALAAQEGADAPLTVGCVLSVQRLHRSSDSNVLHRQAQRAARGGAGLRDHHIFAVISLRTSMSGSRSASSSLSLPFLPSRGFRRLASAISI